VARMNRRAAPTLQPKLGHHPTSCALAARAIKRAPPGLPDALDQTAAIRTRPPGTVINPQPLLVIIRGAHRPAKIKQSVRPAPAKIQTARCCRTRWLRPTLYESPAKAARLVTRSVFAPAIAAGYGRETTLHSRKCCRCRQ